MFTENNHSKLDFLDGMKFVTTNTTTTPVSLLERVFVAISHGQYRLIVADHFQGARICCNIVGRTRNLPHITMLLVHPLAHCRRPRLGST